MNFVRCVLYPEDYLLSGEYVGKLVDTLISKDVETESLLLCIKDVLQDEDYMGICFFSVIFSMQLKWSFPDCSATARNKPALSS